MPIKMKPCKTIKTTFELILKAYEDSLKTNEYSFKINTIDTSMGICNSLYLLRQKLYISFKLYTLCIKLVGDYTKQFTNGRIFLGHCRDREGTQVRINALKHLIKGKKLKRTLS